MICNFGTLGNLENLESIVNLFNINIVEFVENQIKDKIIYFSMVSNKHLNFDNFLKKEPIDRKSGSINHCVKNILNAKLQKFKNNNESESPNNSLINESSNKKYLITQEDSNHVNVPNVSFDNKAVFKKSFIKFLKQAEELKDGEIIYKI